MNTAADESIGDRFARIGKDALALRAEAEQLVKDECRPHLATLESIFKQTRVSVVKTPRRPISILCVPALMSDDFKPESDLLKWINHSGSTLERRKEVMSAAIAIMASTERLNACNLAQGSISVSTGERDGSHA